MTSGTAPAFETPTQERAARSHAVVAPGTEDGWIRRLGPYLAAHKRSVFVAFGVSALGMVLMAFVPLVERQVVDQVIVKHTSPLWPWLGGLLAIGVITFGLSYVRRFVGGRFALDVQYDLRNAIYERVQRLDFASLDELPTGQLVSRASSDLALVQGLLAFLPLATGSLLMLAVSVVIMLFLSPLLTLVALACLPLLLVIALKLRTTLFPATWDAQQNAGEVAGVVDEAVTGVRVVKAFGQEGRELAHLAEAGDALYKSRVRSVKLQARYTPALGAIPVLGQVAVLALGGWLAIHGEISLGTFLAFASYLVQLAAPVRMFAGVVAVSQQARAGAERILELLDSNPLVVERPDAPPLRVEGGEVELDRVTYGYLRSEPVLRDFSLRVRPGEVVALVGPSGSGKSTVSLLLPRFYDVQDGAVRIDGVDVRDVTLESLRGEVGVVFEDAFLFSDSIRANIAYARPDATDAEVRTAASVAGAHEFIEAMPDGYDTAVGERGLTLSGGQRQRVALARALLTNPRILVLDDATSSVDARTEERIHETLRSVMRDRTTILIAHRRSTLRLAKRIVVVEHGSVVDEGSHEELLARCRLYRELLSGPGESLEEPVGSDDASERAAGATLDVVHTDYASIADGAYDDVEGGRLWAARGDAWDGRPSPEAWPSPDVGSGAAPDAEPEEVRIGTANGSTVAEGRGSPRVAPRAFKATPAATIGAGRGGGGHGGGGGWLGGVSLSATPELLAKLDELPPADDDPHVDVAAEATPDDSFTLRRFLRPYRKPLLIGLALVVVDTLLTLAGPFFVRQGLDQGVAHHATGALWAASLAFLTVTLVDWVDTWGYTRYTGRTAERLLYALRIRIFAHLQRLSVGYYDGEMAGRVMTRMTTDVDAFSNLLQTGLITALVSILSFAGVLVALTFMSLPLMLAVLVVVPPLVVSTVWFRRASDRAYGRARESIAAVNAEFQESISGVRVAQMSRREDRNVSGFKDLAGEYLDARLEAQRLVAVYFPLVQFLALCGDMLVLGVGSHLAAEGAVAAGTIIAFLLYLDQFFSPIQQLSQVFDQWQQAVQSMHKIDELMAIPSGTPIVEHPVPLPQPLRGDIEFEGTHFVYPGQTREALRGVNLHVRAGETVALVGETGAGKSTIVKLVARFYDATAGRVLVDGVDLRELDLDAYRRRLGYVPQEAFLFTGTVRDNIAYGAPDASDAAVEAAARAVGAHRMIRALPGGYHAAITERGRSLSSGQRQLLCLARALLVDPAILLLDEATAQLDLASEARVQEAMGVVSAGRTTLLIAHRLQTARPADRIVVVDDGGIVEEGTHDALVARGGHYAELWEAFAVEAVAAG